MGGVDKGIGTVFTRSVRGGLLEDIVGALKREHFTILIDSTIDIHIF